MRYNAHSLMVDCLYERLQRTNPRSLVDKESEYFKAGTNELAGAMDVLVASEAHGKLYIDYWEVKSSRSSGCRHKAYKQAQSFYSNIPITGSVVPRFVLVTPSGVTRISEDQAYHRSPEQ